jgi:hypothetical protein
VSCPRRETNWTSSNARQSFLLGLFAVGLLLLVPHVSEGAIVVPNGLATVEGNSNNGFPFNIGLFAESSMRYQQVYSSSEFSSLGGPLLITAIAFRPDGGSGDPFSTTLLDIQINLSTTSGVPDSLSSTFANNVGADDTIVYARGSLALSSADTGVGPRDFDIVITFTTPFLYDPTQGNLLLDVRNFGGGTTTQFDAHLAFDSTSRAYFGNVNGTTGTADNSGLVTQFLTSSSEPVPEPTTLSIFGLGMGLMVASWSRRWRPAKSPRAA